MPVPFDFLEFPVLETNRLVLREITLADTPDILNIRSDYEVTKYNIGAAYTHINQARRLVERITEGYQQEAEIRWGITLKSSPGLIGMCGFNYWSRVDHRGSIGFDLARSAWGQGIMPEALQAVLRFGFNKMQLNRIEADCSLANHNSQRVLQKLGFRQEGHQREQYFENGAYHDLLLFAVLKREYDGT